MSNRANSFDLTPMFERGAALVKSGACPAHVSDMISDIYLDSIIGKQVRKDAMKRAIDAHSRSWGIHQEFLDFMEQQP